MVSLEPRVPVDSLVLLRRCGCDVCEGVREGLSVGLGLQAEGAAQARVGEVAVDPSPLPRAPPLAFSPDSGLRWPVCPKGGSRSTAEGGLSHPTVKKKDEKCQAPKAEVGETSQSEEGDERSSVETA